MPEQSAVMVKETFAPILYVLRYAALDEAIALQNGCRRASPRRSSPPTCARRRPFLSAAARIAASPTSISARRAPRSVGVRREKETGGGRESGSEAGAIICARHQHDQLQPRPAAGPGRRLRDRMMNRSARDRPGSAREPAPPRRPIRRPDVRLSNLLTALLVFPPSPRGDAS